MHILGQENGRSGLYRGGNDHGVPELQPVRDCKVSGRDHNLQGGLLHVGDVAPGENDGLSFCGRVSLLSDEHAKKFAEDLHGHDPSMCQRQRYGAPSQIPADGVIDTLCVGKDRRIECNDQDSSS